MSTAEDTLADEPIESKRKFLTELIRALDLVKSRKLIGGYMTGYDGLNCAIGAMAAARGIDPVSIIRSSSEQLSAQLDCSWGMILATISVNDGFYCDTNEDDFRRLRWEYVRIWAVKQLEELSC